MTDSFGLFMSPGYAIEGEDGFRIKKLLAHELFHHWNGSLIQARGSGNRGLLVLGGFHGLLRASPAARRRLGDARGALAVGERRLVRAVPEPRARPAQCTYRRGLLERRPPPSRTSPTTAGDVVAMLLDHGVRSNSGGDEDLGHVMRAILDSAVNDGEKVETEALPRAVRGARRSAPRGAPARRRRPRRHARDPGRSVRAPGPGRPEDGVGVERGPPLRARLRLPPPRARTTRFAASSRASRAHEGRTARRPAGRRLEHLARRHDQAGDLDRPGSRWFPEDPLRPPREAQVGGAPLPSGLGNRPGPVAEDDPRRRGSPYPCRRRRRRGGGPCAS